MNRMVHLSEELEQIEFAKAAAKHFAEHPEHDTFTGKEIEPGCLFALRWGMGDDCVYVLKLDEYFIPTIYQQIIKEVTDDRGNEGHQD